MEPSVDLPTASIMGSGQKRYCVDIKTTQGNKQTFLKGQNVQGDIQTSLDCHSVHKHSETAERLNGTNLLTHVSQSSCSWNFPCNAVNDQIAHNALRTSSDRPTKTFGDSVLSVTKESSEEDNCAIMRDRNSNLYCMQTKNLQLNSSSATS